MNTNKLIYNSIIKILTYIAVRYGPITAKTRKTLRLSNLITSEKTKLDITKYEREQESLASLRKQ